MTAVIALAELIIIKLILEIRYAFYLFCFAEGFLGFLGGEDWNNLYSKSCNTFLFQGASISKIVKFLEIGTFVWNRYVLAYRYIWHIHVVHLHAVFIVLYCVYTVT